MAIFTKRHIRQQTIIIKRKRQEKMVRFFWPDMLDRLWFNLTTCVSIVCGCQLIMYQASAQGESWHFQLQFVVAELGSSLGSNNCACPGDLLTFNCLSAGGIATVWRGSAFDCPSKDIILLHSQFSPQTPGPEAGECNNGRIVAHSIGVFNGTFISQLNITVTEDMNNETIECAIDYTSTSATQQIETLEVNRLIINAADSPENIHLAAIDRGHLVFQRSEASGMHGIICPPFVVYSNNCGKCNNIMTSAAGDSTSVSCEILNSVKHIMSPVCMFEVKTEVCGENASIESIVVFLSFPSPPNFNSSAHYNDGSLISIRTSFNVYNLSETVNISNDTKIDGSPISFTITYSDSITGMICGDATILSMSCGLCTHIFNVSSSSCPPSTDINVSIFATNVLGDGVTSDSITIDAGVYGGASNQDSDGKTSAIIAVSVVIICIPLMIVLVITVSKTFTMVGKRKTFWTKKQSHASLDIDVIATEGEVPAMYTAASEKITICDKQSTSGRSISDKDAQLQGCIYADVYLKNVDLGAQSSNILDDKIEYAEIQHSVCTSVHSKQDCYQYYGNHETKQLDESINLDTLLVQLRPQVAPKWYQFGLVIGIAKEVMDEYSDHPDEECLVEVIDYWLRNHESKPTWKEVAKELKEIDLHQLADDIMKSYETGQLPIQVDMEDIPQLLLAEDGEPKGSL